TASCRSVGTCTRLLVANPFLPLGLGMETSVQIGGLPACVLTHADKRLREGSAVALFTDEATCR
ncbi:MAG TPA: hypothetical protein VMX15_01850, partial [Candidatus Heimdallarchaeota archaeon]|nr:hypothetical protein [Candidatus Heimdallarchaeota archaeon]